MILLFQSDFSDIRIQFFLKKSTKSMSCYMTENSSTILTKKSTTFDRWIITSLKSTSFKKIDVDFSLEILIKFENEVDDDKSINITDMIALTAIVVINNSILLLSAAKTLSTEIVATIAYVVAHTIKKFLNQSFLCVNFDFLIVNDLIFSICFELIWKALK